MLNGKRRDTCKVKCFNKRLVSKVKRAIPPDAHIMKIADTFSILGDKTRVKIIFALSEEKELCVCDIANVLGLTISATSHQLRKLRDKNIVKFRNDGNMVYYSLSDRYVGNLLMSTLRYAQNRK